MLAVLHTDLRSVQEASVKKEHEYRIPMALANDNLWGYTSDIIAKYKVRWIEMAAVLPMWTSMIVYYVEGHEGHTMHEEVGRAQ